MTTNWWKSVNCSDLAQGDLLHNCLIPKFSGSGDGRVVTEKLIRSPVIILTQTCDLLNQKAELVALCPVYTLKAWELTDPSFASQWESVRLGRIEGLHLLASPDHPDDNQQSLVVSFRQLFSLPIDQMTEQATSQGSRWRLESPFLEHLSQSFARFFMRVGLPSTIKSFKKKT